jgi:hypothetical protein
LHEELWAGVLLKVEHANFHFSQMGRSIQPSERTHYNVAIEASGTIIDTGWQRSFYAYFDAFLSAVRSVPEILQSERLIPKLADADSCCVRRTGTSIAKKTYGGPMGYRRRAQALKEPLMSQCLRSLV